MASCATTLFCREPRGESGLIPERTEAGTAPLQESGFQRFDLLPEMVAARVASTPWIPKPFRRCLMQTVSREGVGDFAETNNIQRFERTAAGPRSVVEGELKHENKPADSWRPLTEMWSSERRSIQCRARALPGNYPASVFRCDERCARLLDDQRQ